MVVRTNNTCTQKLLIILTDAWWLWQLFSYSEVNSNDSLKVGSFEVVGAVAYDVEEDGGHVDGHEGTS